jgi:DNA-binding LacI/PurR family transcriptional regulator
VTITIKDVARVAGVSYSTVSRALNDSPHISAETKLHVRRTAAEMGYLPSAVGRSLVTQRTSTLGVVVQTLTDPFLAEIVSSVEGTALFHGYGLILASSGEDPEREARALHALRERRVDGVVLVAASWRKEDREKAGAIGIPMVLICNPRQEEYICPAVDADNQAGGRAATQHLLELGHRRIAHIAGPTLEYDAADRRDGYVQALTDWGVVPDPALIWPGGFRPEHGIAAMKYLLASPQRPTAVFCYNDAVALGAMRAAREAGLRIPQDLSVVGFDDIDLAPFLEPPLTTIAQPKRQMGECAVHMLLDMLAGNPPPPGRHLPVSLVVRASTATREESGGPPRSQADR